MFPSKHERKKKINGKYSKLILCSLIRMSEFQKTDFVCSITLKRKNIITFDSVMCEDWPSVESSSKQIGGSSPQENDCIV